MQLLGRHEPQSLVAFGGPANKTAAHLWADSSAAMSVLPSEPGQVLLLCDDRYHFAVGLLAAWRAGRCVGLPPNVQDGRVGELIDAPDVAGIVHDRDDKIGADLRRVLDTQAPDGPEALALSPQTPLVVVYTSGSQGTPTAHPKSAAQLLGEAQVLGEALSVGNGAVVATVPAHHIYGLLFSVVAPLVNGGSFCRTTPLHAAVVARRVGEADAAAAGRPVLVSVPAHLRALALAEEAFPQGVEVVSSGAPLPEPTGAALMGQGLGVREVLGSTETGGIAVRRVGLEQPDPFTALPRVKVAADAEGRLLLESPFLPAEAPQPHAVADRIELLDDGSFRHRGRADDVVKVGSKRVSLGELEGRLNGLDGVSAAKVVAREARAGRGTELAAVVVAPGWSVESLRAAMRRFFDPVVVPRRFAFVQELPVDERGKTTQAALLACLERPAAGLTPGFELLATAQDGETKTLRYRAGLDFGGFAGHFPGFAIVPGVIQVGVATEQATARWDDLGPLQAIRKLKFKRPIFPGDEFELRLTRNNARVDFRFEQPEGLASSGTLSFGGSTP